MNDWELCGREGCGRPREHWVHREIPPGPHPLPDVDGLVHPFQPSDETLESVLAERDAQIKQWRERAYIAERELEEIRLRVERHKRERSFLWLGEGL